MAQDGTTQRYRGVLCCCCNQRIPLPAIMAQLEAESGHGLPDDTHERSGRVFTLRCDVCEKEYLYPASAVAEFEGMPRPRLTRANAAGALGRLPGGLSKAANA
jgi:hypothetical protein